MKLTKNDKRIIKEDIETLKFLISKYTKEKKFEKASNCMEELNKLKKELIREK